MFRDGNLLLAADLCRDTLKIDANNLEALNLLAAVLTEGGLNEQALKELRQSDWYASVEKILDVIQDRLQGNSTYVAKD